MTPHVPLVVGLALVTITLGVPTAQRRAQGALRVGDSAPDFTLEARGGGTPITLSSFRGSSRVALVFGSYT